MPTKIKLILNGNHGIIIRNDNALNAIRRYIDNNPLKWKNDSFNMNDR